MSLEATALLLAWVAIVLLAFAMAGLLRQVHHLRRSSPTSQGSTNALVGTTLSALPEGIDRSQPTLLLFLDDRCESCAEIAPVVETIAREGQSLNVVALYSGGPDGLNDEAITVLTNQTASFEDFGIPATPFGVGVDNRGTVVAAQAIGSSALLRELTDKIERAGLHHE